jgi:hypothetical protein
MINPEPTPTMTLTLTQNDARYVLEALQMLEEKWLHINRTSSNEDEQADYGMDALDLHGTHEAIQREAVKAFGSGVTNFSREPFAPATVANGEQPRPER